MDFRKKTVEEMLTWLESKGYDEWTREVFEGLFFDIIAGAVSIL